jgi:hypothetical protein
MELCPSLHRCTRSWKPPTGHPRAERVVWTLLIPTCEHIFRKGRLLPAITLIPHLFTTIFSPPLQWPPLWFRLGCTSALQHLGGIHSGCALSGCVWLTFRMALILRDLVDNHGSVVVMGVLTNIALIVGIMSAFPWVRNNHHKYVTYIEYEFVLLVLNICSQRFRASSSFQWLVCFYLKCAFR